MSTMTFDDLYSAGIAAFRAKNLVQARRLIVQALQIHPTHISAGLAHYNLGLIHQALSEYEAAYENFKTAYGLNPDHHESLIGLANIAAQLKRYDEALELYDRALIRLPKDFRILSNRGFIYREIGKYTEAIKSCDQAIALNPNYAPAFNNKGIALYQLKKFKEAILILYRAVEINPNLVEAHFNLAKSLAEVKLYRDAAFGFRKSIELNPNFVEAYIGLANVLMDNDALDDAMANIEHALHLAPDHPEALMVKADLCSENNEYDMALELYQKFLRLYPDIIKGYLSMGHLLQEMGRVDDAKKIYEKVVTLHPDNLLAHTELALLETEYPSGDTAHVDYVINKLPSVNSSELVSEPSNDIASLHFALGRIFDWKKDFDRSFFHFSEGNRIKKNISPHDPAKHQAHISQLIESFSSELMQNMDGSGFREKGAIFIVGMPRSGTTLIETILSQHPDIFAAGELKHFGRACKKITGMNERDMPRFLSAATAETYFEIGTAYMSRLKRHAPSSDFITDKLPNNFLHIGAIHLSLPEVKIIHVRRNAIDTCLSNYQQNFSDGLDYSYDLTDVGLYYRQYSRLMNHWRSVLPPGKMFEFEYETLTDAPQETIKALLEYCELEWDDACMNFAQSERRIKTASINQVRKGLYSTSVEKWRRYEKHLGPLIESLGDLAMT